MRDAAPDDVPAADAGKPAWRRWARARRRALADADAARDADRLVARHLLGWAPWREARVALVYLAFGSELDPLAGGLRPGLLAHAAGTRHVLDSARAAHGPALATTRTPRAGGDLRVHVLDPSGLERHPLGFLQPRPDAAGVPLERIDVALVPGLCFDERGDRLGYGRGYYDRLLSLLPARVATVGVVREALIVPRVPCAPHDVRVRYLVSETGVRATGA